VICWHWWQVAVFVVAFVAFTALREWRRR